MKDNRTGDNKRDFTSPGKVKRGWAATPKDKHHVGKYWYLWKRWVVKL